MIPFESPLKHKAFLVGGFVRDYIMNIPSNDIDIVIADTTEEEYEFHHPDHKKVGNTFPVYLSELGYEIALAREEVKIGESYQDFAFNTNVSIEDDLLRRDLSINSIAIRLSDNTIYDPHNCISDIHNKVLRGINTKSFIEDPVRIYRLARFYARFDDFTVDEQTLQLAKDNVRNLKFVTIERVDLELKKAYEQSKTPSRFFRFLLEIDALKIHFEPLHNLVNIYAGPEYTPHSNDTAFDHTCKVMDVCKTKNYSYDVFLGCIYHDVGKFISSKSESYINGRHHYGHDKFSEEILDTYLTKCRFTAYQNKLIQISAKHHMISHSLTKMKSIKLIRLYKKIKNVYDDFIAICDCDHPLSDDQMLIYKKIKLAFDLSIIDIPKELHYKGRDCVVNYVENIVTSTFNKLNI